jgi:hypothetical protein
MVPQSFSYCNKGFFLMREFSLFSAVVLHTSFAFSMATKAHDEVKHSTRIVPFCQLIQKQFTLMTD